MERIRQSFRRKKNKHKHEENTFEVQTVFDSVDDEEPKSLSRIQKIRQSIRSLRKNKKKSSAEREETQSNNDDLDVVDTLDKEEEEDKDDDLSLKDEVEDEPLEKKSKFRLSIRKKKKKKEEITTDSKEKKEKKNFLGKVGRGSKKWESDEERVRSNHCDFKVKYLGFIEVQESRGMEVCEAAMVSLVAKDKKPVKGKLHVTGDGLRVVDKKGGLLVDQVIEKVSFCAPDRNYHHGFSYISRDGTSRRWLCHGFQARKDSGERLSHAVGVAFAVCLENKQSREREGVTATYDDEDGTFTRFGSFRQGTITERLQNPQEFKESVEKTEGAVDNPFAIARPKPGDVRSSMRALGDIRGASPFKRGAPDYTSLRINELPSNISRREKSRVSLILEENFENEETKNEINEMILAMSKVKVENEELNPSTSSTVDEASPANTADLNNPSVVITSATSVPPSNSNTQQQHNNNIEQLKGDEPPPTTTTAEVEPDNPWDLVPDQTKIKAHSRSNSKHENGKIETEGDKWLASLTNKISSSVEESPARGWSSEITSTSPDQEEEEWTQLANRNESVKQNKNNNNPFIAFV